MLFTVIAPFLGRLHLSPDDIGHMKATNGDFTVELRSSRPVKHPGLAVPVDEIAMTIRVPPEQLPSFMAQIGNEPQAGTAYASLKDRLVNQLQTFESGFAVAFGEDHVVFQVRWDQWVEEFTPETFAENQLLRVSRVGAIRPWRELGNLVEVKHLRYYFTRADRYVDLNIPLAFLREGLNSYESGHYIAAFHSYYFIIEDLFAGGQFKEAKVLAEFRKSQLLTSVLQEIIGQLNDDSEHAWAFNALFAEEALPVDVEGFRVLLYRLRGRLHHYARGGGKRRGTPFNQFHFRTAALALQLGAGLALKLQMMEIDRRVDPDAPPGIHRGRLLS